MLRAVSTLPQPVACVLGDLNLVRPLAAAGIACVVASNRGMVRHSRFVHHVIKLDGVDSPDQVVDRLLDFGASQPEQPVLYYQADSDLLMVSRNRSLLSQGFRFLLAETDLVEAMTDKIRWFELAQRLDLPVPTTVLLDLDGEAKVDLSFPIIVKPVSHDTGAIPGASRLAKAVAIRSQAELKDRSPYLRPANGGLVGQQLIQGPETRIESYHVYVDAEGRVAAEFTGRKIRTLPRQFGTTTALEVVDSPDVRRLGRDIVDRLGLIGVAKMDVKRGPDGRLWLLEVNARFTLWNNAGAAAGVNIPALVWADLTGHQRPRTGLRQPRTTWWHPNDFRAHRAWRVPLGEWISFALHADARSGLAWDDPSPLIHAAGGAVRKRAGAAMARVTHVESPDRAGS